jgi:hypothetical protein
MDYYIGDGVGGFEDQAPRLVELDVYNESWHTGVNTPGSSANYWDRLTAAGVSGVYEQAAQAVAAAGATTKLYVNEYNILQNGGDPYGNWYREHIETIENADGDPNDQTVSGIGMQLYAVNGHSADYMQQVLQNMSVTGLPLTLSEFGVQDDDATPAPDVDEPTMLKMVEDSLRMMFGSPHANTFMYWGFWAGATSDLQRASAWADAGWNLTNAGKVYEDLLGINDWDGDPTDGWTTDLTAMVGPDGTIDFTGFYGDYELTIGDQTYALALNKGESLYSLVIAAGDYNGDGIVDGADYTVWRDTLGTGDLRADGNGNKTIDNGDFDVWKTHFGDVYSIGAGGLSAVPEPASVLLLVLGGIAGCVSWRRRPRPAVAAL